MPLEIGIRRFQQIDTVLDSCLNWQESVAIAQYGELDCGKRDTVSDVAATAFERKSFLQDALIYFLRGEPCQFDDAGANDANFTFQDAILPLLKDDDQYFFALALVKLFRARMSTRCGHRHGLSWGSRFSYRRCPTTYGYPAPLRRRRLAAARRDCFITPPANSSRTPAADLAVRLLKSAHDFVSFYDGALTEDQRLALRDAVLEHKFDADVLLKVWAIGCGGVYNLPMDTLWPRADDCAYTKNCVGYDEFLALTTTSQESANALQLARDKVEHLKKEESNSASEWRGVARNWWCHGFMRGIYSWKGDVKINKDIVADVQVVVDRIQSDDLYERVKEASAVELLCGTVEEASAVPKLFIPMTRKACEGASPRDIAHRLEIPITLSAIYSFLFLVATTGKAPKLQDCWSR